MLTATIVTGVIGLGLAGLPILSDAFPDKAWLKQAANIVVLASKVINVAAGIVGLAVTCSISVTIVVGAVLIALAALPYLTAGRAHALAH